MAAAAAGCDGRERSSRRRVPAPLPRAHPGARPPASRRPRRRQRPRAELPRATWRHAAASGGLCSLPPGEGRPGGGTAACGRDGSCPTATCEVGGAALPGGCRLPPSPPCRFFVKKSMLRCAPWRAGGPGRAVWPALGRGRRRARRLQRASPGGRLLCGQPARRLRYAATRHVRCGARRRRHAGGPQLSRHSLLPAGSERFLASPGWGRRLCALGRLGGDVWRLGCFKKKLARRAGLRTPSPSPCFTARRPRCAPPQAMGPQQQGGYVMHPYYGMVPAGGPYAPPPYGVYPPMGAQPAAGPAQCAVPCLMFCM